MTVYVGTIKSAITFLDQVVSQAGDLESIDVTTRATIAKAVRTLQDALSTAAATLDAESGLGGLSGGPLAVSGAFPLNTAAALVAAIQNSEQMSFLQLATSYVGRVKVSFGGVE